MSELRLSPSRKRHRSEDQPLPLNTSQTSKKRRLHHPSGSRPPQAFWGNLSKIWLTESALEEHERRQFHFARRVRASYQFSRRPVTRRALAEWKSKQNWPADKPTADFLSRCSSKDLEGIRLFARHGGPDLRDLSGYRKPVDPLKWTMSSSQPSSQRPARSSKSAASTKPTTITTTSRKSRAYDRNFQQNLIDGAVYPHGYRYPDGRRPMRPDNWKEINERLTLPRSSLSPSKFSEEAHEEFVQADTDARKEKQVTDSVIPIIEGKVEDAKCVAGGIPFTNLDHLTDGAIVPGNPDRYYGARPEQLNRQIRRDLNARITPSTQHDLPIAPNFFLATKGPNGTAAVARNQATYDGALGARGIHSLHSYAQGEPVFDNNAYTFSSIYNDGTLKMYTSHPAQPARPGDPPEYHMTQLKGWAMTSDPETFRKGAAAYRNARDWAKEQRDQAIRRANERADAGQLEMPVFERICELDQSSSLATEASLTKTLYTSQDSRTSLNEESDASPFPQESETLTNETNAAYRRSAKRSIAPPKASHRTHRKRQNAGQSKRARHDHTSVLQVSPVSSPTAEEEEQP
ncbi:MAG: hypothetical protein M1817_001044 [Caeruleum heppii]|nr:MAG: hypothetical protein M1817_001044 [Caeruleum heppii]